MRLIGVGAVGWPDVGTPGTVIDVLVADRRVWVGTQLLIVLLAAEGHVRGRRCGRDWPRWRAPGEAPGRTCSGHQPVVNWWLRTQVTF